LLCSQMTERWNGESSRQLSGGTIYQQALLDRKLNEFMALTVGTRSLAQVDPTGECSNANRVFAQDGNSSINLAS
jgi:hypothetical protein